MLSLIVNGPVETGLIAKATKGLMIRLFSTLR